MDVGQANPFEASAGDYDAWFDAHRAIFESEIAAVESILPRRRGLWVEVGVGTGRFAARLGIPMGVEPAAAMAKLARSRGIHVVSGTAEDLPLPTGGIDAVFFITTLCFVADVDQALREARRVLTSAGHLVTAILPRDRAIGLRVASEPDPFFRRARLLTVARLHASLATAGFEVEAEAGTLDGSRTEEAIEAPLAGSERGSFVATRSRILTRCDEAR